MLAGKDYTAKYGAKGLKYTYIVNDTEAINKARSGVQFDVLHPCIENVPDYVNSKLVQPWDTSLLPSFKNLNPALTKRGQIDGKQYMIPWDWGYASVLYRTDKISPGRRQGLGALLELEVQGQDRHVGRCPEQLRDRRPVSRLPEDRQPDG